MKKKLTLFLVCILVLSLFAGCDGNKEPKASGEIITMNKRENYGVYMIVNVKGTEMAFFIPDEIEIAWNDRDSIYSFYEKISREEDHLDRDLIYQPWARGDFFNNNYYVTVTYKDEEYYQVPKSAQYGEIWLNDENGERITKYISDYEWREVETLSVTGLNLEVYESMAWKPVIYLYPEAETDVSVNLDYDGVLTSTYPSYNGGWNVTAYPDGTLTNKADGLEYSYLFWEGQSNARYDMTKGFVVKGEDTAEFLQNTLSAMGLAPREYNEMIVFWLPQMEHNPYNLITFQKEAYTDGAVLEIDPSPDSVLRVFMAWQKLDEPIDIEQPEIEPFERVGFTVVEWGGTEVR